jgi:phosphopantothenoylcysteine decarboxylase/phosphopantothenate--cysteine ligase
MTAEARKFITPLTLQTLSRNRALTDLFEVGEIKTGDIGGMFHLSLAHAADLVLVAPATANVLAKMAAGLCDDLLTTLLLATQAPVMVAPAMDVGMYDHPALRTNRTVLRERGVQFVEPEEGPLASGEVGPGRLASWENILEAVITRLHPKKDFTGHAVLISAGPTREALDPVRFLSNRSSGKMGYALATMAVRRGSRVILVSGPTALAPLPGVDRVPVTTAAEMAEAIFKHLDKVTVVIMAAAVSDFRPEEVSSIKIKKGRPLTLRLIENEDILKKIAHWKRGKISRGGAGPVIVGFAAETEAVLSEARRKMEEKDLDMIIANPLLVPGVGMETDTNQVTILNRDGRSAEYPLMSKMDVADKILDHVAELLTSS